jgi:hypothetical protein
VIVWSGFAILWSLLFTINSFWNLTIVAYMLLNWIQVFSLGTGQTCLQSNICIEMLVGRNADDSESVLSRLDERTTSVTRILVKWNLLHGISRLVFAWLEPSGSRRAWFPCYVGSSVGFVSPTANKCWTGHSAAQVQFAN